jgi:hypothetical protein
MRFNNGFSSLIRGAGTLGSCPAEPKNTRNGFASNQKAGSFSFRPFDCWQRSFG